MITKYVTDKFDRHFDESGNPPRQTRPLGNDGLVHVCLYFITAHRLVHLHMHAYACTGTCAGVRVQAMHTCAVHVCAHAHRLKGQDIEFMRRLEPHVNLVPVIAKADTMTLGERDAFRRQVLAELHAANVTMFELDDILEQTAGSDDAAAAAATPAANGGGTEAAPGYEPAGAASPGPAPDGGRAKTARPVCTTRPPPFAVCASEDGTRVYPWGTCYARAAGSEAPCLAATHGPRPTAHGPRPTQLSAACEGSRCAHGGPLRPRGCRREALAALWRLPCPRPPIRRAFEPLR